VTALVAAHQAAPHVGDAIASLSRQTVDDLEILVVDDGSTDGTAARVEAAARADPRVRLLRLGRNVGQAAALNAGLPEARGRWLALLDADDEAAPGRLALQLPVLGRGAVAVGGAVAPWCEQSGASAVWRYATGDGAIRARSLFKAEAISGALTVDLEAMRRHGVRFDERRRLGVDWALSLALQRHGPVANVPEVVLRYRIHAGQMTGQMPDHVGSDSALIRVEALARLGAPPGDDELRTHLAVSPCHYWAFGAHPYFERRRGRLAADAARWFARLRRAASRTRAVPPEALDAWLGEIEPLLARALDSPEPAAAHACPAAPGGCPEAARCRPAGPIAEPTPA
jgi:glycosyltransferase involved in cell wall biosynthesis